jgi:hypothetical protein
VATTIAETAGSSRTTRRSATAVENDPQVRDRWNARMKRRHLVSDPGVVIAHVTEVGLWDRRVVAHVILAPTARADDGNPHWL